MLRSGITPVMLNARIVKKIVVSIGRYRGRCLPRISSRDLRPGRSPGRISAMFWPRPGTSFARRAATTKSAMQHDRGDDADEHDPVELEEVPSKKIADGKNSEIDGGWNSPPSPEAAEKHDRGDGGQSKLPVFMAPSPTTSQARVEDLAVMDQRNPNPHRCVTKTGSCQNHHDQSAKALYLGDT